MAPLNVESGSRRTEYHWVAETVDANGDAQTPTDPDWKLYSSVVTGYEPESEATHDERTPIGDVDPIDKKRQQETHEVTVTYDLERFPVDGSGNTLDPLADGWLRDIDNNLRATHSLLEIVKNSSIIASNTVHAKYFADGRDNSHPSGDAPEATALATRMVDYAFGGRPSEPALSLSAGDSAVASVELAYMFDKRRKYQLDQPSESTYLAIRSTDASDTGATITIEAVDGQTVEDITLDGSDATTAVVTTSQYDSLGAVAPAEELTGTLEVYVDESTDQTGEPGQLLTVVAGKDDYDVIEGDEGVPPLGSGSLGDGSTLGEAQTVLGTDIQWFGSQIAETIVEATTTVTNNIEEEATTEGLAQSKHADGRDITTEATVFGETQSTDKSGDHFQGNEGEFVIPLTGGDIAYPRAYCSSGGSVTKESGQAFATVETTFTALEPTDDSDIIDFRPA
ncbi:hypothetical protein ACFPYI_01885 [Halomarina salina]|uniref:Uncharacterized protein n=1 Tax=Halomarina salina TaxID=1872699 RepID=A0ABD5RHY7_9EURY|nr:hypothetical protein [Halomarina salina]